jgi:hypothetical protein
MESHRHSVTSNGHAPSALSSLAPGLRSLRVSLHDTHEHHLSSRAAIGELMSETFINIHQDMARGITTLLQVIAKQRARQLQLEGTPQKMSSSSRSK